MNQQTQTLTRPAGPATSIRLAREAQDLCWRLQDAEDAANQAGDPLRATEIMLVWFAANRRMWRRLHALPQGATIR